MRGHKIPVQTLIAIGAFAFTAANGQLIAQNNVTSAHGATVLHIQQTKGSVDFVHAKPLPLPQNTLPHDATQALIQALGAASVAGQSGYSAGSSGSGKTSPVFLGTPEAVQDNELTSEDFGTNNHPFTTVRADLFNETTNLSYPYRAAGKLFFNEPGGTFICSASLIKRGIVVTAAHCVANYGQKQFYSNWQFVPAYRNGSAPYGVWTVRQAWIPTVYYNGTDNCAVYGVVCPDDVAVLILNTQNNNYAGTTVGWFGYWYGGGFTSNGLGEITQLGYPVGLDSAAYMERNDSYGYKSSSESNDTIIGSNMNGGSSGGPWVENFGLPSSLTGETNGSFPNSNVVVGVTSWGYTATGPKEQGASSFTFNNVQVLLNAACGATPGACN